MKKIKTRYALTLIGLLLALALSACGKAEEKAAESSAPASSHSSQAPASVAAESGTEEANKQTRTVKTAVGEVEIPAHPKRIVTDGYLPNLLVLGIKPVGSTKWELENKVIQDQIEDIESTGENSLEKILSLEPDLIVTWLSPEYDANKIEQYEKIAPTVVIPYNYFGSIYESTRFFGEAFGKEKEAEDWLADLDRESAAAREKIAGVIQPDDTFALMGVFVVDKNFYIYGNGGYRGGEAIYQHLQLKPPERQAKEFIGQKPFQKVSYESVGDYAGDYIFIDQHAFGNLGREGRRMEVVGCGQERSGVPAGPGFVLGQRSDLLKAANSGNRQNACGTGGSRPINRINVKQLSLPWGELFDVRYDEGSGAKNPSGLLRIALAIVFDAADAAGRSRAYNGSMLARKPASRSRSCRDASNRSNLSG
ncbi:ABC transporter substrate-binding protein [Cohnella boryungensis]|uniref:ABC transporter substrate-binding protein n=1 Tax=Cohnella boryungensis TaxID=768479 RepID=A0ABV8SJ08_9BACL